MCELSNYGARQTSSPFSLTTKHCFIGPISENISSKRSFEAVVGRRLTNTVCSDMSAAMLMLTTVAYDVINNYSVEPKLSITLESEASPFNDMIPSN